MIYLDTHVVVWFYANDTKLFSPSLQSIMNEHDWYISPIVRLELTYLHEIGRINPVADDIVDEMNKRVGLTVCSKPFNNIVSLANTIDWTRDPFDRILVAHASLNDDILITSDQKILQNYPHATWR